MKNLYMVTITTRQVVFTRTSSPIEEFGRDLNSELEEFLECHEDAVLQDTKVEVAVGADVEHIVSALAEDGKVPVCCDDCGLIDGCVCDDD